MTRRCDSNPAQYERNRRFGHLVYVLGRSAGGAKLPSVGLCLNASKAESRLVTATISLDLLPCSGKDSLRTPTRSREPCCSAQSAVRLSRSLTWQGGGPKSSVDDLCTGRGVVLGRAATTLRSIETQPFWLDDLSCQLDKSSYVGSGFSFGIGQQLRASALFCCPFFVKISETYRVLEFSIFFLSVWNISRIRIFNFFSKCLKHIAY